MNNPLVARYNDLYIRWSKLPQFEQTLVLVFLWGCLEVWIKDDDSIKASQLLERLERAIVDQENWVSKRASK